MCGIAGILALGRAFRPIVPATLDRMNRLQARRGPDGHGVWIDDQQRVGLAHRRLAIIDVSAAGQQPMLSADGQLCISFNGEIYNHRSLRATLAAEGVTFRSSSDTEILLHLYRRHGVAMLDYLEGMFAFALWDGRRQGLLLARDPFGIKPLYVREDREHFHFASQVRTLSEGPGSNMDPAGLVGFAMLGYVPEPQTIDRHVRALPAGCYLWADGDGVGQPVQYFSARQTLLSATGPAPASVGAAVAESVVRHMESDVPVGLFLSAGVDSTSMLGLMPPPIRDQVHCLTLAFEEYRNRPDDEAPLAARVATLFKARHEIQYVDRAEFQLIGDQPFADMDQPTTDGLNTWLVSRAAAAMGLKVALSGVGGDELLGGYPGFRQIPRLAGALSPLGRVPALGRLLRHWSAPLAGRLASPKYAGLLEYGTSIPDAWFLRRALFMPWELTTFLDGDIVRAGLTSLNLRERLHETVRGVKAPHLQVMLLEIEWYMRNQLLRDADWAGMAHGVEIRTPLVDRRLFTALSGALISTTPPGKVDLLQAAGPELVQLLASRPKTGFTVPLRSWMAGQGGSIRHGGRSWALRLLRHRFGGCDWLHAA